MGTKTELSAAKAAKLNARALVVALVALYHGDTPEDEREECYNDGDVELNTFDYSVVGTDPSELAGFSTKEVEAVGGGEGGGETVTRVVEISHADWAEPKYVSYGGYYHSDDGTSWDDEVEFVFPRQVVVTQYFSKAAATKLDKKAEG
jgi:hypothetical protein